MGFDVSEGTHFPGLTTFKLAATRTRVATATPANELDNLSAILEFRVKHAWRVNNQGKHEEAEEMAARLLVEPALSSVHQGWMHLLLAGSTHDYVHHANEAVRLFIEVLDENKPTATPH
ncbi:hypothetical protein CGMCC3_g17273 [Colletotrichum fructicola]|uniref:Uncharacterized protein n=1 Tax=Colletotrichum fructicola (strain Nara gc5) TaxID=1213859 RepID=A0A7J6IWV0_COLFN|nr:uncharacterized protein CGMCC3_g17273 [Colletotrichum fructicola]KAE9566561.1 hypothetical protein CGMCC3_g17273 [Colletotrichum fructicola]KAF4480431.1 hypothetical protein CGGC5_v010517 [Colletotrichum fructicola Nara gc5]